MVIWNSLPDSCSPTTASRSGPLPPRFQNSNTADSLPPSGSAAVALSTGVRVLT